MSRQWIIFILTLIISLPALIWLPWWTSAIIGFLVILIFQNEESGSSFWTAGIAGALAWIVLAAWQDIANGQILSSKIALLFHLPSPYLLWLTEGIAGLLTTGLAGWLAGNFRKNKPAVRKLSES